MSDIYTYLILSLPKHCRMHFRVSICNETLKKKILKLLCNLQLKQNNARVFLLKNIFEQMRFKNQTSSMFSDYTTVG